MDINSIKTKSYYHNYVTIKQADNTSPIELLLCGPDGSLLSTLNESCTITLLDQIDGEIRQKSNSGIKNGELSFVVATDLKANDHYIEVTTASGRKFPSDGNFTVHVTNSLDEAEINIINSMTKDEAYQKITNEFIGDTVDRKFDLLSADKQVDGEVILARKGQPSLSARLNVLAGGIGVTVKDFPRLDGEVDDRNRFQRAADYLESLGGGKLVVPNPNVPYEIIAPSGTTVKNPYRILVGNNIEIVGVGLPLILMKGMSKSYIDSIDDVSSSGRDLFTVFSFLGSVKSSIKGIRFKGEWDGIGDFRFASPRAKAIGFIGVTDCHVDDCHGEYILGNVVNVTMSQSTVDGFYRWSENFSVINSSAYKCLENGFNYMGGTRDARFLNNYSISNGSSGFESATDILTVSGNISRNNKFTGMSFSGTNYVVFGNILSGNTNNGELVGKPAHGIQITGGGFGDISDNIISNNEGYEIKIYPGVTDLNIVSNTLTHSTTSKVNHVVYMAGTATKPIANVLFKDNRIKNSLSTLTFAVILNYVKDSKIKDNVIKSGYGTASIYVQSTCENVDVRDNDTDKGVLLSPQGKALSMYGNVGGDLPKTSQSEAEPTSGTYNRGDIIDNVSKSVGQGQPDRWRCVASGTANNNPWQAQKSYTIDTIVNANGNVYRAANSGSSGTVAPSHTSGTIADNLVNWEYISPHAKFEVSGQVGLYPSTTTTPLFKGQIGQSGTKIAIAVGTSSAADWIQISN
ncbi:hypothetical protein [Macrococcus equipercicus]|uniref:Right-handed parallel beta-helix repeat-containing protein n=1 Tax=Macrococcus equipercicus TaxID=69967 RepID=A0A9Q9F0T0_9STAP|nr:hypothetical protein [Macrococcus equipercicus]UTH13288.1 right-handed parallel beta-helix repeat-containing protein [Macrococcus equipercicus]